MPLPKILAPLLPQSQCLQQKQHDSVLSPTLPMSPSSNNPYNNMIGLDTEETLVEIAAESATETAIILHEKPTSFDMCDNDLLIESYDEPEQQQKEFTPMPGIEANPTTATTTTTTTNNNNNNTSYQSFGPSSSSLAISLTDSGNETLVEISPDEEIEERITPATSSMDSTTPVTPPQLMEEEHEFIGTMDQQQDFLENPFKPAISDQSVEYGATRDVEKRQIKEPQKQEEEEEEEYFTQPIQAVYTTHQNDLFDEPQEPDFMMKSNFKKSPSREGSLKSKCMKLIHGMKFHLSQERKQMKKKNRMKSAFSENMEASVGREGHIDTNLARSVSTVTLIDEQRLTPIYRRNVSESILCNLSMAEPITPYKSPELGSDAYDIQVLCNQSFFGRY